MKLLPFATALVLGALVSLPAAAAGKVCLNLREIKSSQPDKDGTAITFQMQDGKVWRNDLQSKCSDLQFNGFVWVFRSSEEVCEDSLSLKVIKSGQICQLGKFTQLTSVPHG